MDFNSVDIPALTVSGISLIISLIAFRISKSQTKASIGKPIIMQELLELSEYLHSRRNPLDVEERIGEIIDSAKLVQTKEFILRKSGFYREFEDHKSANQLFQSLRKEIISSGGAKAATEKQTTDFLQSAQNIEDAN